MANFADAFAAQDFYGRQPRTELRAAMEVFLPWLGLAGHRNGIRLAGGRIEIRRTYSQIIAGVEGWEPQGSCKADRQKYKKSVDERLDILSRIGWVEGFGPVMASNGEGECVAIVLTPAGVAQSVRPTESPASPVPRVRGDHPPPRPPKRASAAACGDDPRGPGRAFKSEIVPPRPADTSLGSNLSSPCKAQRTAVGAGALPASAHKARAARARRAEAALAVRIAARGTEEAGARIVADLPWLAELAVEQPTALARAAIRAYGSDLPQTISARWQRRLELAVARIDRYADMGAGHPGLAAELIIDLAREDQLTVRWHGTPPSKARSLGAIALILWQTANRWRAHDRWRTGRRAAFSPPEARGQSRQWHHWRGGSARRRPRGGRDAR